MVKHVVCFKLKDNSLEECKKAQEILLSMKGNVPMLQDTYQNDPYHCSVVKKHMHAVAESSVSVDWEV